MAVDDGYTKSLLHMDLVSGSSTFIDESGKVWTNSGTPAISTSTYKFGGASVYFFGNGKITTPDSDDFNVGSGNFTVDFWMRKYVTGANQRIYGQSDSSGGNISFYGAIDVTEHVNFYIVSGTTYYGYATSATIADTNWHHIAHVRNGNTLLQFIDGTGYESFDVTGISPNNSGNLFAIGERGEQTSAYFNGRIDEFRFSKGIARWTANFTPPTEPYGPSGFLSPMWFF